jgi:AcrR family transcriptional regulator
MTDTQEALLAATRVCVGRKGLAATTSRDITSEAGANLAAITYHFGSKDRLVAEALLAELRDWLQPTLEVLRGDGDPAARTMLAIQVLMTTFERHHDEAPTLVQAVAQAPLLPSLQTGLVDLWTELREILGADIAAMQRADELPGWIEPTTMAAVLVALANGMVLHVTVDPQGPSLSDMAAQFGALILSVRSDHAG